MISVLFYGTIIYIAYKHKVKYYPFIMGILIFYIFSVGISRIYLGVHYASDVVGGWCLGTSLLLSIIQIDKKLNKEEKIC